MKCDEGSWLNARYDCTQLPPDLHLISHVITEYPFSIYDLFGAKLLSQSEQQAVTQWNPLLIFGEIDKIKYSVCEEKEILHFS